MGGAWYEELFSRSTVTDIEQVALDAIRHSLGINEDPTTCLVSVHKVCLLYVAVGVSGTIFAGLYTSVHHWLFQNTW